MAHTLTNAIIKASIGAHIAKSTDFQDVAQPFSHSVSKALASGTGSAQVDVLWADERTLAADAIDTLDLAGVLADVFGDTVTMADVKAILIENTSSTASTISVYAAAADGWAGAALPFAAASQKQNILKGCFWMIGNPLAGWAVGAAATDQISIEEESTLEATYKITVIGATA